jgi:hypothetical protein
MLVEVELSGGLISSMVSVPEKQTTESKREMGKAAKSTFGQFKINCVSTPRDSWSENSKSISALYRIQQKC